MTLGTVVGVAALVAAAGFGASASAQVRANFMALQSTEVVVTDTQPQPGELAYPLSAVSNLYALNGVRAAGMLFGVSTSVEAGVRHNLESRESSVSVLGGSPGLLRAAGAAFSWGHGLAPWMSARRADVVVLGAQAARQLRVTMFGPSSAVLVDGIPFTVVGVVSRVDAEPELLGDAFIPATTALALWGTPRNGVETVIATRAGASQIVAAQAPLALLPTNPNRLAAVGATGSIPLARTVNRDVGQLATVIGIVTLVIGTVGITVAMLLTVVERIYEIGLRRALGATRAEIGVQFLLEAVTIGVLGGAIGTAGGVIVLVIVTSARHWQPVIQPAVLVIAPLTGAVAGLAAGVYPATRAARLEPVDALRR